MLEINLFKDKERFSIRYEKGQETKVFDALVEMVNRPDLCFNWFDAASLSHQLGLHKPVKLRP